MGENYSIKRLDAIQALENRQSYLEVNFPVWHWRANVNCGFFCIYHGQKILQYLSAQEQFESNWVFK